MPVYFTNGRLNVKYAAREAGLDLLRAQGQDEALIQAVN